MEETAAVMNGEGGKVPGVAAPAEQSMHTGTAGPAAERKGRKKEAEDGKYAAARRKAEAERDEAIARMRRSMAAMEAETRQSRGELERQRRGLRDEQDRLKAEEQIRRIGQMDPSVTDMKTLMEMPEYEELYALVKKGMSLTEAFKLCRWDKMMEQQAQRAARQTLNSWASRQHLTSLAGGAGRGDYSAVPAEVAAQFRLAKPGITDGEIRKKYRKYQKYKRQ